MTHPYDEHIAATSRANKRLGCYILILSAMFSVTVYGVIIKIVWTALKN